MGSRGEALSSIIHRALSAVFCKCGLRAAILQSTNMAARMRSLICTHPNVMMEILVLAPTNPRHNTFYARSDVKTHFYLIPFFLHLKGPCSNQEIPTLFASSTRRTWAIDRFSRNQFNQKTTDTGFTPCQPSIGYSPWRLLSFQPQIPPVGNGGIKKYSDISGACLFSQLRLRR